MYELCRMHIACLRSAPSSPIDPYTLHALDMLALPSFRGARLRISQFMDVVQGGVSLPMGLTSRVLGSGKVGL